MCKWQFTIWVYMSNWRPLPDSMDVLLYSWSCFSSASKTGSAVIWGQVKWSNFDLLPGAMGEQWWHHQPSVCGNSCHESECVKMKRVVWEDRGRGLGGGQEGGERGARRVKGGGLEGEGSEMGWQMHAWYTCAYNQTHVFRSDHNLKWFTNTLSHKCFFLVVHLHLSDTCCAQDYLFLKG